MIEDDDQMNCIESAEREKCCAKCRYFEDRTCFCRYNPPVPLVTYGKNNQPFVEYVLQARKEQIRVDTLQSEEGGRFYQEQNRNMIVEAGDDLPQELPEHYTWMTLHQINHFLKFNNYLNIQARSILSALKYNKQ